MANPTPEPNPSSNTTDQGTAATLRNPGELIAAAPHLIGYYPSDALVINIVVGGVIQLTTCYELPAADLFRSLAHRVAKVVARYPGAAVIGMVVCAGKLVEQVLPCMALVTHLRRMIDDRTPLDMFWTAEVTGGARWYYYTDPSRSGIVPNPKTSPVAAQTAAQGMRTFDSRDDLVNLLQPDPPDTLDRRATMIDHLAENAHPRSARDSYRLVLEQVQRSGERTEPLTDQEVADLAVALSDYTVRDACIATTVGDHALAAEKLWTDLTRQFPAPERAEPATLLAFSAYLRGDGVLAAVAVECAESAFPDHRLAELLRAALEVQMPPAKVHAVRDHAVEAAEQLLQGSPRD